MGRNRIDRTSNPLAAMMDESLEELEDAPGLAAGETLAEAVPEEAVETPGRREPKVARAPQAVRGAGRRRGRPRGGGTPTRTWCRSRRKSTRT